MFNRILVANRGEIAVRIMRACRELSIPTVAVYSDPDADAPFVRYAHESIPLGGSKLSDTYLNIRKVVDAAVKAAADAIHPGYGLLSENPAFPEACKEAGIVFIGPPPAAMRAMGGKAPARELVRSLGVPVTPGSEGIVPRLEDGLPIAERIGYPVLVKATAGGGGIGMEMNTRLQVEHPVTEVTTGLDLVHTQIRIAAGEEHLPEQASITRRGHGIECRINAEDPAKNFMPNPGTITRWDEPGGPHVRLDSGVAAGSVVSFHYDPLLPKLIVWAGDRPLAIRRMQRALAEFKVEGVKTTIPFHRAALAHPAFVSGNSNTEIAASVKSA